MTALLEVKDLTKAFGTVKAVDGIHFTIAEGHCVALLGPNGAGKTTTIRMIAGLLKQTSGQMVFKGAGNRGEHRELIGYLPQTPSFHNWMTGFEFVVYAGQLCGLTSAEAKKSAKELVERVGIAGAAKRRIGSYSGGMKQRLGLAQALVHRPKLLVMDEPVSALDPIGRREVLDLLRELKRETTVLFSTHVLHDAEALCDDVIIIREGKVALQGAIETIRDERRKPIINLQLENDESSRQWLALFIQTIRDEKRLANQLSLFETAEQHEGAASFAVKDVDAARQLLIGEMARNQIKISKLEVGHSSLEDLFMKVVGE
ncbi:ABC-2 type transport system ATP-binding protein [Paenibacillus endophyticus]|uniref:ABC-2 type transport system ATP-binding protein n=1 Tax=Paenibacillus endophyticus TaxID=1294268 RepID=A0A7W5GB52_9BACL|nr:ABC transporter ATP-binding protein [Paenibacillus endophyticus]MBB3152607.1 ABC-2 type transport system ATP-binding protein [Paenibacillus endophyticus]